MTFIQTWCFITKIYHLFKFKFFFFLLPFVFDLYDTKFYQQNKAAAEHFRHEANTFHFNML